MKRVRLTVFAVEGSGTKSRAVIFDTYNGLVASMWGGPLNPNVVGLKGSAETLETFTRHVLNTVSQVDAACLASAGLGSLPASGRKILKKSLRQGVEESVNDKRRRRPP